MSSPLLEQLIEALRVLPGVGPKSAQRMAYHVLERDRDGGRRLAAALAAGVEHIGHCSRCRDFSETAVCATCASAAREAHLLCAVVKELVDGCSITRDYARLDFAMTALLEKEAVQAGLEQLIAQSHAVAHEWITDAEMDASPQLVKSMSVSPPRGFGRVRLMRVADVDLQACGGTHVANTAEIGAIRVAKIEKKSARTRRVVLEFA